MKRIITPLLLSVFLPGGCGIGAVTDDLEQGESIVVRGGDANIKTNPDGTISIASGGSTVEDVTPAEIIWRFGSYVKGRVEKFAMRGARLYPGKAPTEVPLRHEGMTRDAEGNISMGGSAWSALDSIWSWFKGVALWVALGTVVVGGVSLVGYMVPATKPIVMGFWKIAGGGLGKITNYLFDRKTKTTTPEPETKP